MSRGQLGRRTGGFALRLAAVVTALVVGPATLAPGTAEAPTQVVTAAKKKGSASAAKTFGWRKMQWDFAWEFGESLSSGPYRGDAIKGGSWHDSSTGTGRVVKYGGGLEFHSGESYPGQQYPDHGTTTLQLSGKAAKRGRWEMRERIRFFPKQDSKGDEGPYVFVVELVPERPADYDCGKHNITVARAPVGGGKVAIQANAGNKAWRKTIGGLGRSDKDDRLYAIQVTKKRITWFVNGRAVASLSVKAAIPKVPMTLRMRLEGKGAQQMEKTYVLIDWIRHYNLKKGKKPPKGKRLKKGSWAGDC